MCKIYWPHDQIEVKTKFFEVTSKSKKKNIYVNNIYYN